MPQQLRYLLTGDWPLNGGALVVPCGTIIDTSQDGDINQLAASLTPPLNCQLLNDLTRQAMLAAYPVG